MRPGAIASEVFGFSRAKRTKERLFWPLRATANVPRMQQHILLMRIILGIIVVACVAYIQGRIVMQEVGPKGFISIAVLCLGILVVKCCKKLGLGELFRCFCQTQSP